MFPHMFSCHLFHVSQDLFKLLIDPQRPIAAEQPAELVMKV